LPHLGHQIGGAHRRLDARTVEAFLDRGADRLAATRGRLLESLIALVGQRDGQPHHGMPPAWCYLTKSP
jgi:hypothetical protein